MMKFTIDELVSLKNIVGHDMDHPPNDLNPYIQERGRKLIKKINKMLDNHPDS